MDLHTISSVLRPTDRAELERALRTPDAAVLGGGTWLFSEPQIHLRALIDVTAQRWPALEAAADGGLRIAATCTLAELAAGATPLFRQCCRALVGSFKVQNAATVGGNVCLALPAGPMTSLLAALDGVAVLWAGDGRERRVPVAELVTGVRTTSIRSGEVLRAIEVPAATSAQPTAFRRASYTAEGRSGVVVIGRRDAEAVHVTITAATERPRRLRLPHAPGAPEVQELVDAIPDWYDDPHGAPDWRAHMAARFAREVVAELTR